MEKEKALQEAKETSYPLAKAVIKTGNDYTVHDLFAVYGDSKIIAKFINGVDCTNWRE